MCLIQKKRLAAGMSTRLSALMLSLLLSAPRALAASGQSVGSQAALPRRSFLALVGPTLLPKLSQSLGVDLSRPDLARSFDNVMGRIAWTVSNSFLLANPHLVKQGIAGHAAKLLDDSARLLRREKVPLAAAAEVFREMKDLRALEPLLPERHAADIEKEYQDLGVALEWIGALKARTTVENVTKGWKAGDPASVAGTATSRSTPKAKLWRDHGTLLQSQMKKAPADPAPHRPLPAPKDADRSRSAGGRFQHFVNLIPNAVMFLDEGSGVYYSKLLRSVFAPTSAKDIQERAMQAHQREIAAGEPPGTRVAGILSTDAIEALRPE